MSQARRVILRVPEEIMDYQDPDQFVRLYFEKLRPGEELDHNRHYIHHQPPSIIPLSNPKVHILIDLEKHEFSGPLGKNFPHDIYSVRQEGSGVALYGYSEPVKQNLLQKIREFSDSHYPWGESIADQRGYI
ncbi:hypothetical protein FE257_006089 [Aspergillus nanangensis]|uniref:Uncharacterized protein n=1 Tax=Aspergillus nanangensis TaxID=2582783 RepID=A0AAD4CPS2_ASPNN|nr:hypothetical protein FE257_006089 [Aspergillus nanangensis]